MAETKLPSLLCYAQTWADRSLRGQSARGQSQQSSEIVKTNLDERSLRILSCLKQTYIWALHCVSQYPQNLKKGKDLTAAIYTGCPTNPKLLMINSFALTGTPKPDTAVFSFLTVKLTVLTGLKIISSITGRWGVWRGRQASEVM